MSKVLIIDDETDICFLISEILNDEKFICESASNSSEALLKFKKFNPDLVILDVWLGNSELDGIELLKKYKDLNPLIPIIIISGHGTVNMAVDAIKNGAYDFIEKPFNSDKLIVTANRAIQSAKIVKENNQLKSMMNPEIPLLGKSDFIVQIKKDIVKIANSNSRVFISGPVGSGKKLISQFIHNHSRFNQSLCFKINLNNITENELHKYFSSNDDDIDDNILTQSNNNTLILENIDCLNLKYQKKFLFLLENINFFKKNKVNLDQKIISLSNKNILEEIKNGNFLQSLHDRLNIINLSVPAINLRRDDILPICQYYLNYYNKNKKFNFYFSKNAEIKLEMYDWPGNISQIINYSEKTIILNQNLNTNSEYEIDNIPLDMGEYVTKLNENNNHALSLKDDRQNFEKEYLMSQIKRFNGNIKKISEFTGMERTALYRKFKSLDIEIDKK